MDVKEIGWKIKRDDVEWTVLVHDSDEGLYASVGNCFACLQLDKSDCEMLLEFIPKIMEARGWK